MSGPVKSQRREFPPLKFAPYNRPPRTRVHTFERNKDGDLRVKRNDNDVSFRTIKEEKERGEIRAPLNGSLRPPTEDEKKLLTSMQEKSEPVYEGLVAEGGDSEGPFQTQDVYVDEMCKEPPKPWTSDAPCCPVHTHYGMVIKEVHTRYGPAQLHHCPHEECIIACFGTNEERDDFLHEVATSFHFMYRDPQCPLTCYCNELLVLKLSKSEKNPHRLYMTCRKKQDRECTMFQWADDFPHPKVLSHWGGKSAVPLGGKN